MNGLRIDWKSGYMLLFVDEFFPTTEKNSRKIAKLINKYCSKIVVDALIKELHHMEEIAQLEEKMHQSLMLKASTSKAREFQARQARVCASRRKRIERDRKNIEGGMS